MNRQQADGLGQVFTPLQVVPPAQPGLSPKNSFKSGSKPPGAPALAVAPLQRDPTSQKLLSLQGGRGGGQDLTPRSAAALIANPDKLLGPFPHVQALKIQPASVPQPLHHRPYTTDAAANLAISAGTYRTQELPLVLQPSATELGQAVVQQEAQQLQLQESAEHQMLALEGMPAGAPPGNGSAGEALFGASVSVTAPRGTEPPPNKPPVPRTSSLVKPKGSVLVMFPCGLGHQL